MVGTPAASRRVTPSSAQLVRQRRDAVGESRCEVHSTRGQRQLHRSEAVCERDVERVVVDRDA
jgi:hypothetical protein